MSNSYTKAAFVLTMSAEDASLIRAAEAAANILDTISEDDELKIAYDGLGERFATVFPPTEGRPFSSFLELFDDPAFPHLGARIEIADPDETGQCQVTFSGEEFGVEPVAHLIFTGCKSALPCGFAWSYDCDRMRVGEFGGGCVVITGAGATFDDTTTIIDRAMARATREPDEAEEGYVLATRHPEHGLSFWNNDTGFDRLALATVFDAEEAARFDTPIADDEPEWLAVPAPLPAR